MTAVAVAGGTLAVHDCGSGPAALLIHGSVLADSMRPLAEHLGRRGDRRVVRPHRRGYGGSTAPTRASIGIEAEDHRVVLDTLGISRADVIGWSHGGTVAIELARRHPHRVRSLVLLEPALLGALFGPKELDDLLPASLDWIEGRRPQAVDRLLTHLWGPSWRPRLEQILPDAASAAARDLDAVFGSDFPAQQDRTPEPGVAAAIGARILHVGGSASGPVFDEIRDVLGDRLPAASFVTLDDADHLFAVTRAAEVATALAGFLHTASPTPARAGG